MRFSLILLMATQYPNEALRFFGVFGVCDFFVTFINVENLQMALYSYGCIEQISTSF